VRVGANFGPYRVVRQIGAGGMGAVYLGQHELIGRHAAIKVLLPELSAQKKSVDRFFNEARATSAVSDPGIVQIYDFGFTPEQIAFIVMEFLDGESLDKRLTRLKSLATADALRITRQVAGSLAAAHAAGFGGGRRAREDPRLRHRQALRRRLQAHGHAHRPGDRHAGLHVARAVQRVADRRSSR
jgi:serine/threonine protein kinase